MWYTVLSMRDDDKCNAVHIPPTMPAIPANPHKATSVFL